MRLAIHAKASRDVSSAHGAVKTLVVVDNAFATLTEAFLLPLAFLPPPLLLLLFVLVLRLGLCLFLLLLRVLRPGHA